MTPFTYARAEDVSGAIRLAGGANASKYLGGGTNLVDHVERLAQGAHQRAGEAVTEVGEQAGIADRLARTSRGDERVADGSNVGDRGGLGHGASWIIRARVAQYTLSENAPSSPRPCAGVQRAA